MLEVTERILPRNIVSRVAAGSVSHNRLSNQVDVQYECDYNQISLHQNCEQVLKGLE